MRVRVDWPLPQNLAFSWRLPRALSSFRGSNRKRCFQLFGHKDPSLFSRATHSKLLSSLGDEDTGDSCDDDTDDSGLDLLLNNPSLAPISVARISSLYYKNDKVSFRFIKLATSVNLPRLQCIVRFNFPGWCFSSHFPLLSVVAALEYVHYI